MINIDPSKPPCKECILENDYCPDGQPFFMGKAGFYPVTHPYFDKKPLSGKLGV